MNLEGAAQMIEILALLHEKTRGNLTAEERQVLLAGGLIAHVRLGGRAISVQFGQS